MLPIFDNAQLSMHIGLQGIAPISNIRHLSGMYHQLNHLISKSYQLGHKYSTAAKKCTYGLSYCAVETLFYTIIEFFLNILCTGKSYLNSTLL